LEQQHTKLKNEKGSYQQAHDKDMREWIQHIDWIEAKELYTPEAEYHRKVIKNMEEAIIAIKAKIQELRDKVMVVAALDELKDKINKS
jgi:hypothetical protein